jgi:hypothetical protein
VFVRLSETIVFSDFVTNTSTGANGLSLLIALFPTYVHCLDLRGRLQAEYVEDKNNSPLFTYNFPRCVVSTKSGSLCYIDCTSVNNCNGRVVMFSDNKFIQWTYVGNSAINKDNPFAPK